MLINIIEHENLQSKEVLPEKSEISKSIANEYEGLQNDKVVLNNFRNVRHNKIEMQSEISSIVHKIYPPNSRNKRHSMNELTNEQKRMPSSPEVVNIQKEFTPAKSEANTVKATNEKYTLNPKPFNFVSKINL